MSLFPHYTFCKIFFEEGEDKARKFDGYCELGGTSHRDCFTNVPSELDSDPLWWVMPWGGVLRQINFDIEKQKENKANYTNRFIKLLKSVEKNKLILNCDHAPPVHKLKSEGNSIYILQDGHHRSAIHCYFKDHNMNEMIKSDKRQKGSNLILRPTLLINREHIIKSSYCHTGLNSKHFSIKDTYAWFELPFKILEIKDFQPKANIDKLRSLYNIAYSKANN